MDDTQHFYKKELQMFSLFSSSSVDAESPSLEVDNAVASQVDPEQNSNINSSGSVTKEITPSEPSSWNEAHDRYCKDKAVLRASIRDVVQDFSKSVDYELPWELPSSSAFATSINDIVKPSVGHETVPVKSEASGGMRQMMWNGARRLGSSLISTVFQHDELDDDIDMEAENDAIQELSNSTTTTSSSSLNWDLPVIHVQHTNSCLQSIDKAIDKLATNEQSTFKIMAKSEWRQLCSQTNDDLLSRLPPEDLDWLLEILIKKGRAKLVNNEGHSELVVVSSSTLPTSEGSTLDVAVAVHKLKQARSALQRRIDDWTASIQECRKKAAKHKAAKQTSLAIVQLKKSKLLQKQIDSSANALLELEKVQSTIEITQSNQVVLGLLAESSKQLRNLTQQTSLDEVDEIKDDLEENIAVANQISESLATNSPVNEDELLAELEALTLNDEKTLQALDNEKSTLDIANNDKQRQRQKTKSEEEKQEEVRQPVMA